MNFNLILEDDQLKIKLSKEAKLKGISLEKYIAEILEEYMSARKKN